MPIEFPCPSCRQQVRTPDAAAGKKGQCPNCGALVMIPAPAVLVKPAEGRAEDRGQGTGDRASGVGSRELEPEAKGQLSADGRTIEFACTSCGMLVRTPATAAGRKGKCPHCFEVVHIPAADRGQGTGSRAQRTEDRGQETEDRKQEPAQQKPVEHKPPKTKPLQTKPAASSARLPVAKPLPPPPPEPEIVDLEEYPAAPPLPTPTASPYGGGLAAIDGLVPLGPAPSAPTGGLTPLLKAPRGPASPGLAPLGPAPTAPPPADPFAGLAPLPQTDLTPLGITGSSAVSTQSPFGADTNPYASPAASSFTPSYQQPVISDRGRRGLPWEREPGMDSFTETMNEVLGAPGDAFQKMRRSGGVANPMGFFIVAMVVSQIASAIDAIIGLAILFGVRGGEFPIEALVIFAVQQLVGGVFLAVLGGAVGPFLGAALYHVCLVVVGSGNAGYEATYRAVCFAHGSAAVLNVIPCLGPAISFIYGIVVLIHAFTHAHETSGGKAAFAVLFPLLVCCCAVTLLVGPALAAAYQAAQEASQQFP